MQLISSVRAVIVYCTLSGLLMAQSAPVPAGTIVQAKLGTAVKTATAEGGDEVIAFVTKAISVERKVIVPQGSRLHGRVETVQPATRNTEGRVRLVFREIQFPDGRRIPTWITNSFTAPSKSNARYPVYMTIGGVAGGLIGGKKGRIAGVIGGVLTGFVVAGNRTGPRLRDLTLKAGQEIRLQLGEDLSVANNQFGANPTR